MIRFDLEKTIQSQLTQTHSVYFICILFGDSESKIVFPSKRKKGRKKKRKRKRNADSGENTWPHQFSSINAPWDPNGDIPCSFFDVWSSHSAHMLTSLSFLKSNSNFCLFVWMSKFQWVQVFYNNCGSRQRRGKLEAVSETLKCIKHLSWFNIKWSNTWACLELSYFSIVTLVGIFVEEVQNTLSLKKIPIVNITWLQHYSSRGRKRDNRWLTLWLTFNIMPRELHYDFCISYGT